MWHEPHSFRHSKQKRIRHWISCHSCLRWVGAVAAVAAGSATATVTQLSLSLANDSRFSRQSLLPRSRVESALGWEWDFQKWSAKKTLITCAHSTKSISGFPLTRCPSLSLSLETAHKRTCSSNSQQTGRWRLSMGWWCGQMVTGRLLYG